MRIIKEFFKHYSHKIIYMGLFILIVFMASACSSSQEDNADLNDNINRSAPDNLYPWTIRIDGILYTQSGNSEYTILDIKNGKIDFIAEGKIESTTDEINSYPEKDNQTNYKELVGCEYCHIDGKLCLLYKNQLIEYVKSRYQP